MTQLHRLNNVTILLVDGDSMVRNSLSLAFKVSRSFLQTARTGEEALPDVAKNYFDMILFDFNLPKMDGLTFFRKAQKIHPSALYIGTPSWWNDKLVKEAFDIGIHQIVLKPFSIKTLSEILLSLIENQKPVDSQPATLSSGSDSIDEYRLSGESGYPSSLYGRAV